MQNIFKKNTALFMALVMAMAWLNGCASSADINQKAALSYNQEINQVRDQGALDTNSATAKRVHQVFHRMLPYAKAANQTGEPFNWEINVIRSEELNAWAMPGGKMVFYTGLVERLNLTDDEIATVMGHEMAHALKEHGKKKVNVGTASNILGYGIVLVTAGVTGVDISPMVSLATEFGLNKPYSRSNETEADEVGLMLMAKAGYNPQAAPNLWQKMNQASQGSNSPLAGLISTHPTNDARQKNLERLMPQALAIYQAQH